MMHRLVGSMLLAGTLMLAGTSAIAQDLPKQSFKVLGTWSNLTNWQANEHPLWTKTIPEASKGQITANIQSVSELGLKGTELIRLLKLGLFDFAHGVTIYIAEVRSSKGLEFPAPLKIFRTPKGTTASKA